MSIYITEISMNSSSTGGMGPKDEAIINGAEDEVKKQLKGASNKEPKSLIVECPEGYKCVNKIDVTKKFTLRFVTSQHIGDVVIGGPPPWPSITIHYNCDVELEITVTIDGTGWIGECCKEEK